VSRSNEGVNLSKEIFYLLLTTNNFNHINSLSCVLNILTLLSYQSSLKFLRRGITGEIQISMRTESNHC